MGLSNYVFTRKNVTSISYKNHNDFLEKRGKLSHLIGASELASVIGLNNKYTSNVKKFYEKLGIIKPDEKSIERMIWGNLMEKPIAEVLKYYDLETGAYGYNFENNNAINSVREYRRILHDRLYNVSIDYLLNRNICELKTAYVMPSDDLSLGYVIQSLQQMRFSGKEKGYIVVFSQYQLKVFEINYSDFVENESFWDVIDNICLDFQNRIIKAKPIAEKYLLTGDENLMIELGQIEPNLIGLDDFSWKPSVDESVVLDAETTEKVLHLKNQISSIKPKIKELQSEVKNKELEIKSLMNDKEYLMSCDEEIIATYKTDKRGARRFSLK
jgi:predicted phage-related endonuclease